MDVEGMVAKIQQVKEKRFELAESAPISTTTLHHSVDFLADTSYALDLVSGKADLSLDIDEVMLCHLPDLKGRLLLLLEEG